MLRIKKSQRVLIKNQPFPCTGIILILDCETKELLKNRLMTLQMI